jgi:uncharacterized protein YheU (UPF0270 family)
MSDVKNTEIPIEIPPEKLSEQATLGIIENFILREGTDYGTAEVSLAKKVEQIKKQITGGEIKIVFDQVSESINLMTKHEFKRLTKKN